MKTKSNLVILLIIIVVFITNHSVTASHIDSTKSIKGISISYWNKPLTYTNGFQIGMEKYLLQTEKFKVIFSTTLNLQRRKDVYSAAGLSVGSALRRTYKFGLFLEYGIKLGYQGSYYDFNLYKLNSDDKVVNVGRKWISSAIFGYSFGLGYDFAKVSRLDLQLFVKPNLYYKIPNNDNVFYYNNIGLEAGLTFHPKWFR
jgi:hypothetical protein